jgi:parallel beta-helix repeat protein
MQSATSGASIYYTTDGSIPTQSSTLYSGAMTLTSSSTLNAKGFMNGYNPSTVASASFTNKYTSATGATYYVATTGDDSNPGTQTLPFKTLTKAMGVLASGDTLYIRGGTYKEQTQWPPSGTASAQTLISNYNGETVTIQPPSGRGVFGGSDSVTSYIIINGLIFDGSNSPSSLFIDGFGIEGPGSHHVTIQNGEIKNFPGNGMFIAADYNIIRGMRVHDNATNNTMGPPHGFYVAGAYNLFEDIEIYNHGFYGMQMYNGPYPDHVHDNIVRRVIAHHNALQGITPITPVGNNSAGIMIDGINSQAYNNISYSNGLSANANYGGGIQVRSNCTNCRVLNNTVYGNRNDGIYIARSIGVEVQNNISTNNGTSNILDQGNGTILSNNLTVNPMFVNTSANDFRVISGSPAIDTGTDLTSQGITTDIIGTSRPEGLAFDIGAYEYMP